MTTIENKHFSGRERHSLSQMLKSKIRNLSDSSSKGLWIKYDWVYIMESTNCIDLSLMGEASSWAKHKLEKPSFYELSDSPML